MKRKNSQRLTWRADNVLHVVRVGPTTNAKISAPRVPVVQTYHFSRAQFQAAGGPVVELMRRELTHSNCLSCPFASGGCYTHKFTQARGFSSMLRSIAREYGDWQSIPTRAPRADIIEACTGRYVRFGSYGEPVLLPLDLVARMADVSDSWTGYTHAWRDRAYAGYSRYYMASTADEDAGDAERMGWREFSVRSADAKPRRYAQCPAAVEAGKRATCATCQLCSGRASRARSVSIIQH